MIAVASENESYDEKLKLDVCGPNTLSAYIKHGPVGSPPRLYTYRTGGNLNGARPMPDWLNDLLHV